MPPACSSLSEGHQAISCAALVALLRVDVRAAGPATATRALGCHSALVFWLGSRPTQAMPATKQEEQGHAHRSWSPPKPLSSLSLCLSCMCLSALACSRCCCSAFPHTRPACSLTLRWHVSACAGSNQRSRVASAVKQRDEALKELAIGLACCFLTLRLVWRPLASYLPCSLPPCSRGSADHHCFRSNLCWVWGLVRRVF